MRLILAIIFISFVVPGLAVKVLNQRLEDVMRKLIGKSHVGAILREYDNSKVSNINERSIVLKNKNFRVPQYFRKTYTFPYSGKKPMIQNLNKLYYPKFEDYLARTLDPLKEYLDPPLEDMKPLLTASAYVAKLEHNKVEPVTTNNKIQDVKNRDIEEPGPTITQQILKRDLLELMKAPIVRMNYISKNDDTSEEAVEGPVVQPNYEQANYEPHVQAIQQQLSEINTNHSRSEIAPNDPCAKCQKNTLIREEIERVIKRLHQLRNDHEYASLYSYIVNSLPKPENLDIIAPQNSYSFISPVSKNVRRMNCLCDLGQTEVNNKNDTEVNNSSEIENSYKNIKPAELKPIK